MSATSFPPILRTKYLPKSSRATMGALRSKNSSPSTFLMLSIYTKRTGPQYASPGFVIRSGGGHPPAEALRHSSEDLRPFRSVLHRLPSREPNRSLLSGSDSPTTQLKTQIVLPTQMLPPPSWHPPQRTGFYCTLQHIVVKRGHGGLYLGLFS